MISALRYWWNVAVCAVRGHDWGSGGDLPGLDSLQHFELCKRCCEFRRKP